MSVPTAEYLRERLERQRAFDARKKGEAHVPLTDDEWKRHREEDEARFHAARLAVAKQNWNARRMAEEREEAKTFLAARKIEDEAEKAKAFTRAWMAQRVAKCREVRSTPPSVSLSRGHAGTGLHRNPVQSKRRVIFRRCDCLALGLHKTCTPSRSTSNVARSPSRRHVRMLPDHDEPLVEFCFDGLVA